MGGTSHFCETEIEPFPLHKKTADSILPSAVFILSEFTYAPPDTFQYPLDSISGLEARQG